MRDQRRFPAPFALAVVAIVRGAAAFAQASPADDPVALEPVTMEIPAAPSEVTAYVGRAAVTRTTSGPLMAGIYELRFTSLPEAVQPETIQARAVGAARVLGVDYVERPAAEASSPRVRELDRRIDETRRALAAIAEDRTLLAAEEKFIDGVSVRATTDASAQGGTPALDLDVVREQLAFVSEQRARLLERRRALDARARALERELALLEAERAGLAGASGLHRDAVVSLAVLEQDQVTVHLVYLVRAATWEPRYSVRAAPDGSRVTVEYDAAIAQNTGEDWVDVALTLSTAVPTVAANPPTLTPWFVDERTADKMVVPGAAPARRARGSFLGQEVAPEDAAADAEVRGAGPSVTYHLPRRVTARSDDRKQARTRIATIDTPADFIHVATPLLTEAVYVRGELTNASAYQLLPGAASIFVGQDFVGPTRLGPVAPNRSFELYFGIDRAVTARRVLVSKETTRTGLLGGGRRTRYDFRIEVENGAGKTITLELWDRVPVSRSDRVEIQPVDLSHPIATDPEYVDEQRPQGLLKWPLTVPPRFAGAPEFAVTWGLTVARPKDLEITPLPE